MSEVPSIQMLTERTQRRITLHNGSWIPHFFWMVFVDAYIYKTCMEGTYDIPTKNPYIFVTTEPYWMGFSPKCRKLVLFLYSWSTVRAPVFGRHQFFGTSEYYGKTHGSLLTLWMNYNYTACCWFPTSSNILVLPSQFWQIGFESYWLHCSKCRILVLLRYIKVDLQFWKLLMLKVQFVFFLTIGIMWTVPTLSTGSWEVPS